MPNVTVSRNFTLKNLKFFTRDDLRNLGLELVERIKTRTKRGVDADGRPFQRYSPRYAELKGGYVFQGLVSALAVDLTVTSEMLNNMSVVEVTDTSVTLGFLR